MPDLVAASPARAFIAEHAHYADDAGFWEAHAARLGGPVVDLGAAAGRVAVPLAATGVGVVAVDSDPEMLAVLMERAAAAGVADAIVPLVAGMAEAPLPHGTPLVICPMNTLQVLLAPDDRATLFANVSAALAPGGEFVFDLSVPDFTDICAAIGHEIPMGVHVDPGTGDVLTHTAVYEDADPGRRDAVFRIVIERRRADGGRAVAERRHHVHLYDPDEVRALAADAALRVLSVAGGFADEPFDPHESERQVWRLGAPVAP